MWLAVKSLVSWNVTTTGTTPSTTGNRCSSMPRRTSSSLA